MLIEKIESFQFAGKLFATEKEAVTAALTEIAVNIVKKHSGNPLAGLLDKPGELATLLSRYTALTKRDAADEAYVAIPKPVRPLTPRTVGRKLTEGDVGNMFRAAAKHHKIRCKQYLAAVGVDSLADLLTKPHLYAHAYAWAHNMRHGLPSPSSMRRVSGTAVPNTSETVA